MQQLVLEYRQKTSIWQSQKYYPNLEHRKQILLSDKKTAIYQIRKVDLVLIYFGNQNRF